MFMPVERESELLPGAAPTRLHAHEVRPCQDGPSLRMQFVVVDILPGWARAMIIEDHHNHIVFPEPITPTDRPPITAPAEFAGEIPSSKAMHRVMIATSFAINLRSAQSGSK